VEEEEEEGQKEVVGPWLVVLPPGGRPPMTKTKMRR